MAEIKVKSIRNEKWSLAGCAWLEPLLFPKKRGVRGAEQLQYMKNCRSVITLRDSVKTSCSLYCGSQRFLSTAHSHKSHGPCKHKSISAYWEPHFIHHIYLIIWEFLTYQKTLRFWVMTLSLRIFDEWKQSCKPASLRITTGKPGAHWVDDFQWDYGGCHVVGSQCGSSYCFTCCS
jgi:hypothetical protein